MNKFKINVIVLALSFAFSTSAMALSISRNDYKAGKGSIAAEYKLDKAGCVSLSGNLNDICMAEADGRAKVARAELDDSYKPTLKTRYLVHVTRAEADYAVAKERCVDAEWTATRSEVCVTEAKSLETAAKTDARTQMKISEANVTSRETPTEANNPAQACAANMQAHIAAFRASFLQQTYSDPRP